MFNLTVICCNALIFQKVSDFRLHWHLMIANTKKKQKAVMVDTSYDKMPLYGWS